MLDHGVRLADFTKEGDRPLVLALPPGQTRTVQVINLAGERVPKSKKLLKLSIRVGEETRTLVAGVAEHYEPAALVGRKVVIVANLEPATLMGVESNGMVLAASHEGTVSLLTLDKDVPSGSKVK